MLIEKNLLNELCNLNGFNQWNEQKNWIERSQTAQGVQSCLKRSLLSFFIFLIVASGPQWSKTYFLLRTILLYIVKKLYLTNNLLTQKKKKRQFMFKNQVNGQFVHCSCIYRLPISWFFYWYYSQQECSDKRFGTMCRAHNKTFKIDLWRGLVNKKV